MTAACIAPPPSDSTLHDAAHWLAAARREMFSTEPGPDSRMCRYGRLALAAARAEGNRELQADALVYAWYRTIQAAPDEQADQLLAQLDAKLMALQVERACKLQKLSRIGLMVRRCRFVQVAQIAGRLTRDFADLHPIEQLHTLNIYAVACKWLGRFDELFDAAPRCVQLADQTDNHFARASMRINLASPLTTIALNPEGALAQLAEAVELLRHTPINRGWAMALSYQVQALDMLGRHDEAHQVFVAALARPGAPALMRPTSGYSAPALMGVGRLDEAEIWLGDEPQGCDFTSRSQRQVYGVAKARLLCMRGRFEAARATAVRFIEPDDSINREPLRDIQLYDSLRQACMSLGDMQGALDAAVAARQTCLPVIRVSARARYLVAQLEAGAGGIDALRPIDLQRLEAIERCVDDQVSADVRAAKDVLTRPDTNTDARSSASASARPADDDSGQPEPAKVPSFLAHVVHELRNPIGGVMGMADLLMRSELSPKQRHFVRLMRSSADTLLNLVNDVLDMAKLESGRFTFNPRPTSLQHWLREAVEPFVEPAALRGVEIAWSLDPALPAQLCFDALRLHQVLANLLSNARKFTRAGSIHVTVSACGATCAQGVPVRVAVRDTGCGIAPEAQAQLFREFVQAHAGIAASHGGTGLGLAISRQLIERLGGRMGVDSEPGVGSTFWFELTLPMVAAPLMHAD